MKKPEFNGQCSFAISLGSKQEGSEKWRIEKNGKVYLFSNLVAKILWMIIPGCRKRAEKNWEH